MNQKIAVCISGLPRTFEKTAEKMRKVFGNADFYFSTWATEDNNSLPELFKRHKINLVAYEFVSEPLQLENEKKILNICKDGYPDFFILNQWIGVKRAIQLMLDYRQALRREYDVVFRCRFDLDLNFSVENALRRAKGDALNYITAATGGGDQFLYGSPETMSKLLGFNSWLMDYVTRYGSRYGFHASPLVRAYFLELGIPINRVDLPMSVMRPAGVSGRAMREERTRNHIRQYFPEYVDVAWKAERVEMVVEKLTPWSKKFHDGKNLFYLDGQPD